MHTVPLLVSVLSAVALTATPPATTPRSTPALPSSYTLSYLDGLGTCSDPVFTAVSPSGTRVATACGRHNESDPRLFVKGKTTPITAVSKGTTYTLTSIDYVKDNGVMSGVVVPPTAGALPLGGVWSKPDTLRVSPPAEGIRFTQVSGVDGKGDAMLISRIRRNDAYLWWKADGTTTPIPDKAWLPYGNGDGTFYAGMVDATVIAGKRQGKPVTWEVGRGLKDLQIDAGTEHTFPAGWVSALSPGEGRVIGTIHVYNNQTKKTTARSVELFEASGPVNLPLSPAASGVAVVGLNDAGIMVGSAYTQASDDLPKMLDDQGRRLSQALDTRAVVMTDQKAEWLDTKVKNLPAGALLDVSHVDSRGRIYVAVATKTGDTFTRRLAILTPKG